MDTVETQTLQVTRSFGGRAWVTSEASDAVERLLDGGGVSRTLARLLAAHGIKPEAVEDYLHPTLRRLLPDPSTLADMDKAVARTLQAVRTGERIALFGDYDVDGSSSAALLSDYLSAVSALPTVYVPDRMTEGYGPNAPALLKLQADGATLVITVDCGAGAGGALSAAAEAGLDVVVLDHHACEVLPTAFAHVNPNRPGDASGLGHICAAGVVFLFAVALNRALREAGWFEVRPEPDLRDALDIVALATVCDVVPLIGVNRAFVRTGLNRLDTLQRPGIAALAQVAKVAPPFTAYHLGFVLGPRINAGGRVGRCGLGADLLRTRDAAEAMEFATALDIHNSERQALEKAILDEAYVLAEAQADSPFLFLSGEGWHPGVVGIVAGRLKERFGKPTLVAGFEGGLGRGSARSVAGVNIGALVRAASEAGVIAAGGGHAMAAGFSLSPDQCDGFRDFLCGKFADIGMTKPEPLVLDALVSPAGATLALVGEIARMSPFGAGNPEPVIGLPSVRVSYADVVGKDHVRLTLVGGDGSRLAAIAFRAGDTPLGKALLESRGRTLHVAGFLRKNEWNGRTSVQLQLQDAAPAGA